MNQTSDTGPDSEKEPSGPVHQEQQTPHANWREALMALIAARIALIQLESRIAAKEGGRRAALVAAACGCAFFTWALLLAGGISIASNATGWKWDIVAMVTALLHLVVGALLFRLAKPAEGAAFPITRAEFQKDREWIENFNKTKKSND